VLLKKVSAAFFDAAAYYLKTIFSFYIHFLQMLLIGISRSINPFILISYTVETASQVFLWAFRFCETIQDNLSEDLPKLFLRISKRHFNTQISFNISGFIPSTFYIIKLIYLLILLIRQFQIRRCISSVNSFLYTWIRRSVMKSESAQK
jgi:hypothetical protein